VLGLYMMALGTIYPVGAVVQGALARAFGVDAVTAASGLVLIGVVGLLFALRPGLFGALDDPEGHDDLAVTTTAPPEPATPEPTALDPSAKTPTAVDAAAMDPTARAAP
jgi:hypothetical protein